MDATVVVSSPLTEMALSVGSRRAMWADRRSYLWILRCCGVWHVLWCQVRTKRHTRNWSFLCLSWRIDGLDQKCWSWRTDRCSHCVWSENGRVRANLGHSGGDVDLHGIFWSMLLGRCKGLWEFWGYTSCRGDPLVMGAGERVDITLDARWSDHR